MQESKLGKSDSLGFLISDTARLLRKRFDHRARELGLTRAQWQVLAYLAKNEGINQVGLADILDIEPITLSRHLDKLEQAGWVLRRADPNDKRVRLLVLSEQASTVLNRMRIVGRCLIDEVTAGLTPEQVQAMREGLQHVRDALSERGSETLPVDVEINVPKRNVQ